jgi:carbon monoxide dehydrogenase subunit G
MSVRRVQAAAIVGASPEAVFAFLADLENHWSLTSGWVEVRRLDRVGSGPARGGRVRLHGPLGLRRTAHTQLLELDPPARVAGTAAVGRRTRATIAWDLVPDGDATLVRLSARIDRLGLVDRLLWATVGQRVMARGFPAVLARLQSVLGGADSGSVGTWPTTTSPTSPTTTPRAPKPAASPSTTPSSSAGC